jgi:hypothetical protein
LGGKNADKAACAAADQIHEGLIAWSFFPPVAVWWAVLMAAASV